MIKIISYLDRPLLLANNQFKQLCIAVVLLLGCIKLTTAADLSSATASAETNENTNIMVFHQDIDVDHNPLVQALKQQLPLKLNNFNFQFVDLTNYTQKQIESILLQANNCALTIGSSATQKVLSVRKPINLFSISISRNLLDKLHSVYARLGIFVSGIYQEQPLKRQVYLAKAMQPELKSVGILLEQADKFYLPEYQQIAVENNLQLKYRILSTSDSPEKYLTQVADESSYLFITNNPQLFAKSKLAALVLSAYYHQIKLVGSQYDDAKIGALASVYTSPTALAIETSSELKQLCLSGEKNPPRYANSFSVVINQQIAENFGVNQLKANGLSRSINQKESQ